MKYILSIILMILLVIPSYGIEVPDTLKPYIKNITGKTEFKKIVPVNLLNPAQNAPAIPEFISKDEALNDLEQFRYLWKNAYSGSKYWQENGLDFNLFYKKIEDIIDKNEKISVVEFENEIVKGLECIQDGHFIIEGKNTHQFFKRYNARFSNILVEENNGRYEVLISKDKNIPAGSTYNDSENNLFPTLSPLNKKHYLLGEITSDEDKFKLDLNFVVNGKKRKIPVSLHDCLAGEKTNSSETAFSYEEVNKIPVVTFKNFSLANSNDAHKIVKYGKKCRGKEKIVIDLLDNGGGNVDFYNNFLIALNNSAYSAMEYAKLYSPPIIETWANTDCSGMNEGFVQMIEQYKTLLEEMKKNPERTWEIAEKEEKSPSAYKGKAYILINRLTGSSGEDAINFSRSSLDDVIVLGENTMGITTFGDQLPYMLPNTKIKIFLPAAVFYTENLKEGYGYLPDYWIDSSNPADELMEWLNNPEEYQFSFKEDNELKADFFNKKINLPGFFKFAALQPGLNLQASDIDFEEWYMSEQLEFTTVRGLNIMKISIKGQFDSPETMEKDDNVFMQGNSSLHLSSKSRRPSDIYFLYHFLPSDIKNMEISFSLKINAPDPASSDIVFAGIKYTDKNGKYKYYGKDFKQSMDWSEQTIKIDPQELQVKDLKDCQFFILANFKGELWIDNLKYQIH